MQIYLPSNTIAAFNIKTYKENTYTHDNDLSAHRMSLLELPLELTGSNETRRLAYTPVPFSSM